MTLLKLLMFITTFSNSHLKTNLGQSLQDLLTHIFSINGKNLVIFKYKFLLNRNVIQDPQEEH